MRRYVHHFLQVPEWYNQSLLRRMQQLMLQHRLQALRYAVQIHLLLGLSVCRKYCRHREGQNDQLHAVSYGIRMMWTHKLEQLLHLLQGQPAPVLLSLNNKHKAHIHHIICRKTKVI